MARQTGWVVVVMGAGSCYLYGPFETWEKAESWVFKMRHEFAGRAVHVIRNEVIAPD